jgi:ABC-type glycerol-3-phosphate transport system permease component
MAQHQMAQQSTKRLARAALNAVPKYVLMLVIAFIFLAPVFLIFMWSLKTEAEIGASPLSLPTSPKWENFINVWNQGRYSRYIPNSLIYSTTISTAVCILSCLAGYAFAKIRFPGRDLLFTLFLIGLMVPFFAVMVPLYFLARDLVILGTRWALILPGTALALPFGILLMRSFFLGLPQELVEAAKMDGCNEFGAFLHVMLPLAFPGLATLAVFEFMWTWNMFVEPLVLVQRDALRSAGLAVVLFQDAHSLDRGMVATGVLLTILPIIILYLLLQRKFIEGITAGALK